MKPPKKDENPKLRKKKDEKNERKKYNKQLNETSTQKKITSLFQPLKNDSNPRVTDMSELPRHRSAVCNNTDGEIKVPALSQNNLSVGESYVSADYPCTKPDLAGINSFQTKTTNPSKELSNLKLVQPKLDKR